MGRGAGQRVVLWVGVVAVCDMRVCVGGGGVVGWFVYVTNAHKRPSWQHIPETACARPSSEALDDAGCRFPCRHSGVAARKVNLLNPESQVRMRAPPRKQSAVYRPASKAVYLSAQTYRLH